MLDRRLSPADNKVMTMKPQRVPDIYRTQNDTDKISLTCQIITDDGTVLVADDDTVTLHVAGPETVTIEGSAKGDDSGTFLFDPADIKAWPRGKYEFEVQVNDGTYVQTIGTGRIVQRNEIA